MMMMVDVYNHYWLIAGVGIYSSKSNTIIDASDPDYVAWLNVWREPSPVASEADLKAALLPYHTVPEWLFNADSFIQPAAGVYTKSQLKAYSADARWRKEQGGITFGGLPIATDDRSKQMVLGARVAANADPEFTTKWAGVYPLTAQQVIAISNAVLEHVSSCFEIFGTVSSGIDDGTITTLEQIDAAFAMQE